MSDAEKLNDIWELLREAFDLLESIRPAGGFTDKHSQPACGHEVASEKDIEGYFQWYARKMGVNQCALDAMKAKVKGWVNAECGHRTITRSKIERQQQQISELRAEIEFRGKRIDELIKSNACNFDKAIKSIEELHKKKYEIETHRKLDLERISQIAQLQSTVRRYERALTMIAQEAATRMNSAFGTNAMAIADRIAYIAGDALTESTNPPQQVESRDTRGEKG